MSLAAPVIGERAHELFDVLREFERPGRLRQAFAIVDARSSTKRTPAAV
jgi:hypothetical protein